MNHLAAAAHWAWNTSLAASVLIIPALLFSLLFRHPCFTPIRYMLGLLIVARLLLPFTLPSPLSIFNLINPQPTAQTLLTPLSPPTPLAVEVTRLTPPPSDKQILLTSAAAGIWILGVALFLTRVVVQHFKVRRWLTANNRRNQGAAFDALNSALSLSNCRRKVALYSITGLHTPALCGLFRPAILLPADLVQSNDAKRLRLVSLHEIAHLHRKDILINWLMIIAQSLHWFNPLVWLTLRRLRSDQELLCDEAVMRRLRPEEHHTYGETLLALASPRAYAFSTLIPVSSNFKQLKERIAMIKQFKPATRRLLMFTLPPLAALLAVLTFTAATDKKVPPMANAPVAKPNRDVELLEKQFAMESDEVMKMEHHVDELRKVLRVLANTEADLLKESQVVRRIESDRIHAQQEYVQNKHLLAELKKKDRKALVESLPTAYRDAALESLLLKLHDSQQQLAGLEVDKTPDHPDCQRVRAVVKYLASQIDERANGILSGLEATTASRKAIVDEMTQQLGDMKVQEAEFLERARPYFRAKRDLETHQKVRDALYMRLLEGRAESELKK